MNYTCTFYYKKNQPIYDHTSFSFEENKITILLGHNGAGKTTLLKCISGILPSSSKIEDCWFIGSNGTLIEHFSLMEHLKIIGAEDFENYINLFDIGDVKSKPIQKLSTGQKMICSIIVGLYSGKKYLLLDEPFAPLDPVNTDKLLNILEKSNRTIIITSHDLFLTKNAADKIYFIKNGKIVFETTDKNMTIDELKSKYLEKA